jgi:hypothetical protein
MVEELDKWLAGRKHSVEENEKILEDPATGYSDYFAASYRLSQQRIVKNQIYVTKVMIGIIAWVVNGYDVEKAVFMPVTPIELSEVDVARNRRILKPYLDKVSLLFNKA